MFAPLFEKVLVKLFQKLAVSQGSALSRAPQSAESLLFASLFVAFSLAPYSQEKK
jgi:hypothetical protein